MSFLSKRNWTASNHARLEEMLAGPAGLAVFDFDNTLIYRDLGEASMYYVALQGLLPGDKADFWECLEAKGHLPVSIDTIKKDYEAFLESQDEAAYARLVHRILSAYHAVYEKEGMEAAYRWSAILFAWQPVSEWQKIARHVFAEEQEAKLGHKRLPSGMKLPQGIRKYQEIADLILALQKQGWTVKIVTASPRELISAVISDWGLLPEDVIGMKLAQKDGVYEPRVLDPMPFGQGKIEILREALGGEVQVDFAAGDSQGDIELLRQAGRLAVLIDRGYELMRHAASEHDHILLQPRFIDPLPLANGVAAPEQR